MNEEKSFSVASSDVLAASGHVGYVWDLVRDEISWFGSWRDVIGGDDIMPPANAKAFSERVLSNDHHLIFGATDISFDRTYRLHGANHNLVPVIEHGTTFFEKGRAVRQQGVLRKVDPEKTSGVSGCANQDRDPLTGRPSRTCLIALIDKISTGPLDVRKCSAYLAISVDKLAFMNLAMGPKMADLFLCAVADRLSEILPARSIIGRAGGDIFGVLLPGVAENVPALAKRILDCFHDRALTCDALSLHVPVSIGSVTFDDRRADAMTYMILAEQALAEARENGGNRYLAYVDSPDRSKLNRSILEIGERIKHALKNDALQLAFQPVVDSKTGEVVFYEALSRIFKEDGQTIMAGEFIPIVEKLGLAPDFDRHVLDKALAELALSDTLKLAVNISGLTAALPDWPAYVQSKLSDKPQIASRLIIEITENAAVLDIAKIKCLVDSLRQMGSLVALDDFGAGATSIRHLRDLSLAIMKLDRDLLDGLMESAEQQHLVRMLTSIAHGLGLRTVAEGIETEDVAAWLRAEDVDMLQGYLLGQPSFMRPWLSD